MSNVRFAILIVSFGVIALSCTPDDDKYKRIVNKSWIQDSSHSFLTAYSFEFEDYVGKTLEEYLKNYPDSSTSDSFMDNSLSTLGGWSFRYSETIEVWTYFNYDSHSDTVKRDSMPLEEWSLEDCLSLTIQKFKVYDLKNENTIIPRKRDRINRVQ